MPRVWFWYEFASTYSYPAALRVEALARARGVVVEWRPLLLGPLFFESGWRDSPFNLYPVKGRYMWRDLERQCATLGLAFRRPDPFPQNSLLAARVATLLEGERRAEFSRRVYLAEFAEGRPIASPETLGPLLAGLGLNPTATLQAAQGEDNKARLKAAVEEAKALGIFGAPTFITEDGELFWGNDRLEQALDWAKGVR